MRIGIAKRREMPVAIHGQGVRSQRRLLGSRNKNSSRLTSQKSMVNFAQKPRPMARPSAIQAHFFSSKIAMTAKQVASAQKKKNGGVMVIKTAPAAKNGARRYSRTSPSA